MKLNLWGLVHHQLCQAIAICLMHLTSNDQANVNNLTYAWQLLANTCQVIVKHLASKYLEHMRSEQHPIDRQNLADGNRLTE